MSISVVGSTSSASATGNISHTLGLPAGLADGDFGLLTITQNGNSVLTPPTGWSVLRAAQAPDNSLKVSTFYKVLNASDSGTSINYSFVATQRSIKTITAFRGVAGLDVTNGGTNGGSTVTSTLTYPGLTPLNGDCLEVALAGMRYSTTTTGVVAASGWSEVVDIADSSASAPRFGIAVATKQLVGQANVAQAATNATLLGTAIWGAVTATLIPLPTTPYRGWGLKLG